MKYKYKNDEFEIEVCTKENGYENGQIGLFHVISFKPYNIDYAKSYEEIIEKIREGYDKYHSIVPDTKKGWIDLFTSCVIQTGYEDWHIDEDLAMRLLKLYKEKG